jgi:membrane peptidoglycan carboxypeptidase
VFTAAVTDDVVGADWDSAQEADCALADLEKAAETAASFAELPAAAANPKNYAAWNKTFSTWLFRMQKLDLMRSPSLGESSKPGESERDFRVRLQQAGRERRDQLKASLQSKYGPKLEQLQRRKVQAEQKKAVEKEQSTSQILSTVMTAGAGILGAFMGRKTFSATNINKATQAVRAAGRAAKEYSDVGRADETVEMVDRQLKELNAQFEAEVAGLDNKVDPTTEVFETITVRPKKTGISVQLVALGWKPE